MKAIFKNTVIAESDKTVVLEGNHYFHPSSVKKEYLEKSSTTYTCPWKGEAEYYHVVVNGERNEDAAWVYLNPKEEAKEIAGQFAFGNDIEIT